MKDVVPVQLFLNTRRGDDDFGDHPGCETKAELREISGIWSCGQRIRGNPVRIRQPRQLNGEELRLLPQ